MYSRDTLSLIVDDSALRLSQQELSEQIETQLAGLSEFERESFDDVLRTVGRGAQTALPGVAQGAAMGATAGPWGALIGGLAGGAISLATASQQPGGLTGEPPRPAPAPRPAAPPRPAPAPRPSYTPPPAAAAPPAPMPVTPTPTPTAATAATASGITPVDAPSGSPNPAGQLLWAMQNPRVLQAVASLVAGPVGRQEVPVGQSAAPPAAFLNLLNVLATQAGDRAASHVDGGPRDAYLRDAEGELAWDVVNPEARARALYAHLREDAESVRAPADDAGAWLLRSGLAELELDAPLTY